MRSKEEVERYNEIFQFEKLLPLFEAVERVSPPVKKTEARKMSEEVLEI